MLVFLSARVFHQRLRQRDQIAARQLSICPERRPWLGRAEGFARWLSVIPEEPLALVMGGRNVMTGHFKGDSLQGRVTLSLTTLKS